LSRVKRESFKDSRSHKIRVKYFEGRIEKVQKISPEGRAGDFHMLRYWGFDVNDSDFTLRCLACENLRLVQDPGINLSDPPRVC
jgi:hypothetical protein